MESFGPRRVGNPEEARQIAEKEKPLRDMAREEGVSPEEKATLDRMAEKKGDSAQEEIESKSFVANKTINGVETMVHWDDSYKDYVIYFPQVDLGNDQGVYDQVIRLGDSPEDAKKIFEAACGIAETESDVYKVYKKIEMLARELD